MKYPPVNVLFFGGGGGTGGGGAKEGDLTLKLKVTKRQLFEVLLRSWDWWVKRGCTKELVGETKPMRIVQFHISYLCVTL